MTYDSDREAFEYAAQQRQAIRDAERAHESHVLMKRYGWTPKQIAELTDAERRLAFEECIGIGMSAWGAAE